MAKNFRRLWFLSIFKQAVHYQCTCNIKVNTFTHLKIQKTVHKSHLDLLNKFSETGHIFVSLLKKKGFFSELKNPKWIKLLTMQFMFWLIYKYQTFNLTSCESILRVPNLEKSLQNCGIFVSSQSLNLTKVLFSLHFNKISANFTVSRCNLTYFAINLFFGFIYALVFNILKFKMNLCHLSHFEIKTV